MILLIIAYIIPIAVLVSMLIMLFQGNIRRQRDVITFQAFLLILVFWLIFLWLTDLFNQPDISLKLLRFALMFGSFAPAFFFVFSEQFIHRSSKLINVLFFTVSTAFAILSLHDLHAVQQRAGDVLEEVGGGDEEHLREIERHAEVVVGERVVLRRIQHLEQRRRRIALERRRPACPPRRAGRRGSCVPACFIPWMIRPGIAPT